MKKASGFIVVDGREVAETYNCCHCGSPFAVVRGSGKTRGYCLKCSHVTCGQAKCDPCLPFERKLELIEGKTPTKSDELDYIFKHPEIL